MYVIVGLGNPGARYEVTRHNMGFIVLDNLADELGVDINKNKFNALTGEIRLSGQKVLLVKPQTFMNLSGNAVSAIMNYYDVEPENLIVVYDDVDIECGAVRIRKQGSAGTHNGMKSIVSQLGYTNFPRIRMGIGKGDERMDLADYVLGKLSDDEIKILETSIDKACKAIKVIICDGIDKAMNQYNG